MFGSNLILFQNSIATLCKEYGNFVALWAASKLPFTCNCDPLVGGVVRLTWTDFLVDIHTYMYFTYECLYIRPVDGWLVGGLVGWWRASAAFGVIRS